MCPLLRHERPHRPLLADGTVLVVGSVGSDGAVVATAERYDPATGSWADAEGSLAVARTGHTATVLGGPACRGPPSAYCDPSSPPCAGRSGHTATVLDDGSVLLVGGRRTLTQDTAPALASAQVYTPGRTPSWTPTASMTRPRVSHTATPLGAGKSILVAGGADQLGNQLGEGWAEAEQYDSATRTWAAAGTMGTGRGRHSATALADGTVLVAGGATASSERFHPSPAPPKPTVTGVEPSSGPEGRPRDAAPTAAPPVTIRGSVLATGGVRKNHGGNAGDR